MPLHERAQLLQRPQTHSSGLKAPPCNSCVIGIASHPGSRDLAKCLLGEFAFFFRLEKQILAG